MTNEPSIAESDVHDVSVEQGRRRHPWRIACGVGVVLALISPGVVCFYSKTTYQAEAFLLIRDTEPVLAFSDAKTSPISAAHYARTQPAMICSSPVLRMVINDGQIRYLPEILGSKDPVAYVREKVKVVRDGDSRLVKVLYTSHNPVDAAKILNAIIVSYLQLEKRSTSRMIATLDAETQNRASSLRRLRREFYQLSLASGRDPLVDWRVELELKRGELRRAEDVYEAFVLRVAQLRTECDAPARVTLLDPARVPPLPIAPWPYVNMAAAAIVGLLLPLSLTGVWRICFRKRC